MLKGISPLIAGVLMVAFTIALGAIVSSFFIDFTNERSSDIEQRGDKTLDCSFAKISIPEDGVGDNLSSGNVTVTALNTGQENLYGIHLTISIGNIVYTFSPTAATERNATNQWSSGQSVTFVFDTNVTGTMDYVILSSDVCPNAAERVDF